MFKTIILATDLSPGVIHNLKTYLTTYLFYIQYICLIAHI